MQQTSRGHEVENMDLKWKIHKQDNFLILITKEFQTLKINLSSQEDKLDSIQG